jgi:PmbA protein
MTEKKAREIVQLALKRGAAEAEVFFLRATSALVEAADGSVETLKLSEDIGAGLRVFTKERRVGFAYSSDLTNIAGLAESATRNASAPAPDEHNVLPEPKNGEPVCADLTEDDLAAIPVSEKIEKAFAIETAARSYDKRIARVRYARYADSVAEITIANSRGIEGWYKTNACTASILAVAEESGNAETGSEFDFARRFDKLDCATVGAEAARRAASMLGAKRVASGTFPVVLDRAVSGAFIELASAAVNAENVLKGKSFWAEKLGQTVASDKVTVLDDSLLPQGIHRAPIDDEGTECRTTSVIDRGVLKSYLHNAYTASKMDVQNTGNAVRESFSSVPHVGGSNFYLVPGQHTLDDLFALCDRGLYVMEVIGMHTADPISGDFSVGVEGLWIDGGTIRYPVRGVTIAGNVSELLQGISAVANDLKFYSRYGAPSVLVSRLTISGE